MKLNLNRALILILALSTSFVAPSEIVRAQAILDCNSSNRAHPSISDLCQSISNPERYLEYFHCTPKETASLRPNERVIHYIFQESYTDKENLSNVRPTRLFKAFGSANETVLNLKSIELIDRQVDGLSSDGSDLKFASHTNHLVFDLIVTSTDGELLTGKITDMTSKKSIEVTCLDISLEK